MLVSKKKYERVCDLLTAEQERNRILREKIEILRQETPLTLIEAMQEVFELGSNVSGLEKELKEAQKTLIKKLYDVKDMIQ